MELFSGDSLCESSAKLLHIGTESDLDKEILANGLGFVDSSKPGFVIVILQNFAFTVQLDRSEGKRIELGRI